MKYKINKTVFLAVLIFMLTAFAYFNYLYSII